MPGSAARPDRLHRQTGLDLDVALTALFTVLALDAVRDLRGDLPTPFLAAACALAARLLVPGQMLLTAFALFTVALLARRFTTSGRPAHV